MHPNCNHSNRRPATPVRRINQILRAYINPNTIKAILINRLERYFMTQYMQNMMLALCMGILGLTIIAKSAQSAPSKCAQRTVIVTKLNETFGERRQSVGLTPTGEAFEMFAHPQTGTWTIILTLPNGTSCMMASGTAYQAINTPAGQGV